MAFMAPLMMGAAATTAGVAGATATVAATTGLIGSAGTFSAMAALKTASTVLSIAGGINQAAAQKQAGKDAEMRSEYEAKQLDQAAGQDRAVSQRKAGELRRRAQVAESRALAVGAAGGGNASGITHLMAGIGVQGEENAQAALYDGEERARGKEGQAAGARYSGAQAKEAGKMNASSTIMSTAANLGKGLFDKYAPSKNPVAATSSAYDYGQGGDYGIPWRP